MIHKCMRLKQFVGAVGGSPNFAYNFVGTTYTPPDQNSSEADDEPNLRKHGRNLIYLDPHIVQSKCYNLKEEYKLTPDKFHHLQPRMIELKDLDPSISFGYLLNNYDDYKDLIHSIYQINQNVPEQMKIVTIQSEGIEQRILNDIIRQQHNQ
jgi:hypothetical protein